MPYTSWGYMTHEDIADAMESMDLGLITITLDNAPEWFAVTATCPRCERALGRHDAVRVGRASGEIEGCTYHD
jgi:hypothetical protein